MSQTPAAPDWAALRAALTDFHQTPGRFALALREPRALFEHTRAVLQLAAGRSVEGLAAQGLAPGDEAALRQAARFAVRTVLLRPGADHYALLGLAPDCDADAVREHYRLLIRLTHPDFAAGGGESWPADAATRINLANDVLSAPERRADYDVTLLKAPAVGVVPAAAPAEKPAKGALMVLRKSARPAAAADRAPREWWRLPRGAKIALVSLGALGAVVALLMGSPSAENSSLAVRKQPAVANPTLQAETGLTALVGESAREAQVETVAVVPVAEAMVPVAAEGVALASVTGTAAAPGPKARARRAKELAAAETTALAEAHRVAPAEASLSLMMETRMTAPRLAPAPAAVPVAPAVAREPVAKAPTLAQVQPVLSNLVGNVPSGRGENLAVWIDADFRPHPDTGRFVGRFNQLLAGQRVTQLGEVRFSARAQGAQLVVDGVIVVHTLDTNEQARTRDLHLRAFFQPHEGRTALTQLVAGPLQ